MREQKLRPNSNCVLEMTMIASALNLALCVTMRSGLKIVSLIAMVVTCCSAWTSWGGARAQCIDYDAYPQDIGTWESPIPVDCLATEGTYAYIGGAQALYRVDLHDPASPVTMDYLQLPETEAPRRIAIDDNRALVVQGGFDDLLVIDIGTPDSLSIAGICARPEGFSWFLDADFEDGYAYVADNREMFASDALRIFDLRSSDDGVLVSSIAIDWILCVAVSGQTAFVGHGYGDGRYGVTTINIGNRASPAVVGTVELPEEPVSIDARGDIAYVAVGASGVVSVSSNATIGRQIETEGLVTDVYLTPNTNYVYLAGEPFVFEVIDISGAWSFPVFTFPGTGATTDISVEGSVACLAGSGNNVRLFDVQTYEGLSHLDMGIVESTSVSDGYAYIGQREGLAIADVADPRYPCIVGFLPSFNGFSADYVVNSGDYTYWTNPNGMTIADTSDPSNPTRLYNLGELDDALILDVAGGIAAVPCDSRDVWFLDVSNPPSPQYLDRLETPGRAVHALLLGDLVYILDFTAGLIVADLANPSNVQIVTTVPTAERPLDLVLQNDRLYVLETSDYVSMTLEIFSLSTVDQPQLIGTMSLPERVSCCAMLGNHVYLPTYQYSSDYTKVYVVDMTDPSDPEILMNWKFAGYTRGIEAKDGLIYFSTYAGLWIYQAPCGYDASSVGEGMPCAVARVAAYPNPFNAQSTIVFDLPSEMKVGLRVYDAAGRLVTVLMDGVTAHSGRNSASWLGRTADGRAAPSGVYFAHLKAGKFSETTRLTLLK